jgi:hypothetical protein
MSLQDRIRHGEIPEDWQITAFLCDIKHVYEEFLWEIAEYEDTVDTESVIIHSKTAYRVAVLLKVMHGMAGSAEDEMVTELLNEIKNHKR